MPSRPHPPLPPLCCAVHCRLVVAPLARLVFEQERREGDLRYAHLRLRWAGQEAALEQRSIVGRVLCISKLLPPESACVCREHCAEVAQYKAEGVERRALDGALEGALANQVRPPRCPAPAAGCVIHCAALLSACCTMPPPIFPHSYALACLPCLQQRLVRWRTVLACTTRALDYCGALLNYGCVAAAVFAGAT